MVTPRDRQAGRQAGRQADTHTQTETFTFTYVPTSSLTRNPLKPLSECVQLVGLSTERLCFCGWAITQIRSQKMQAPLPPATDLANTQTLSAKTCHARAHPHTGTRKPNIVFFGNVPPPQLMKATERTRVADLAEKAQLGTITCCPSREKTLPSCLTPWTLPTG